MARTFFRVKQQGGVVREANSTKEIQHALSQTAPGEYPVEIIISGASPGDAESCRHWGRAIKHEDGMVHLVSDQPGD